MNTLEKLEWATIVGATILLFGLAFMAIPLLEELDSLQYYGQDPDYTVNVNSFQWCWVFTYPDGHESGELTIGAGDVVRLELESEDVIHSFYVRELGFKTDIIPGKTRIHLIKADVPGEYWIQCAEFCGAYHGGMRTRLVVEA